MAQFSFKQREYGGNGKVSASTVFATNLTAGNFAAQMTAAGLLADAIDAVSLGTSRGQFYTHTLDAGGAALPSDPEAQRENKWLVSCRETSGGLNAVTFTIPCATLTFLATDGENMADGAERTALINAVEAFVLSNDLVAVTVESIKFRTRSA